MKSDRYYDLLVCFSCPIYSFLLAFSSGCRGGCILWTYLWEYHVFLNPGTEGMWLKKGHLGFLAGTGIQMTQENDSLPGSMSNLGLPTTTVPSHKERTHLLNEENHKERKTRKGKIEGWINVRKDGWMERWMDGMMNGWDFPYWHRGTNNCIQNIKVSLSNIILYSQTMGFSQIHQLLWFNFPVLATWILQVPGRF